MNSLTQTLLKHTAPGVPDLYQGTELWDLSLVDPDNRRPVDYELRQQTLANLKERTAAAQDLAAFARMLTNHKEDGRIKLYLTWRAHSCQRDHAGLFSAGEYLPAEAAGPRADHVFGFILCFAKNFHVYIRQQLRGHWQMLGREAAELPVTTRIVTTMARSSESGSDPPFLSNSGLNWPIVMPART